MMNTQIRLMIGLFLVICFSSNVLADDKSVPLPAGTLKGKQVKKLFHGKTVSANSIDGKRQLKIFYFHKNGKITRAKKGRLTKGKWKVQDDGRLCINLKGKKKYCRLIVKKGKKIEQHMATLDGKYKHELTYAAFKKGKKLGAISEFPILPAGTLTKKQVIALFSDQTISSETVKKKRTSLTYYAPDGTVEQVRNGKKRFGKWRASKNGRMCLQMENLAEKCRIIVEEDGELNKYIVKKNGSHQHSVRYRKFIMGKKF